MHKKAIFLDRDGTLIVDQPYLNDPAGVEFLPGVFEALSKLHALGFEFVVVTNQSGIPRGLVQKENLDQIHAVIRHAFIQHGIDFLAFYYAPFMPESNHPDRKPNPGMIEKASREHKIAPEKSWMIGDKMTDVEAGRLAGTHTLLLNPAGIDTKSPYPPPEAWARNWSEAAQEIFQNTEKPTT